MHDSRKHYPIPPDTMPNTPESQPLNLQPIQISIPHSILPFGVPLSTYLSINPRYTNLAIGACVFSGRDPVRLLLVQRASTERSFPNCEQALFCSHKDM